MNHRSRCVSGVLGATVVAAGLTAAPSVARANVQIAFPTQAMDKNLVVSPGTTLEAGYDFTMPGGHPAAKVSFPHAQVSFNATCASGQGGGLVTIKMSSGSYIDPLNNAGWFPSADQSSLASYEGAVQVPNLCNGAQVSLQQGGTFAATLESSDATNHVNVRWHYGTSGASGVAGNWSPTLSFIPGPGGPPPPPPPPQPTQIIVKIDTAAGHTISNVTSAFPVKVDHGGLASRGIYLVSPITSMTQPQLQNLANQINGDHGVVVYAQVNLPVKLADTEFYAWPYGSPHKVGQLPSAFTKQPAATTLQLTAAHTQSLGAGVTVAVLDTGADPTVPALKGRLLPGWNYVADNGDTADVAARAGNAAVGHGTFVSGLVALVAPKAKILPYKVLNSQGYGTIYGVSQAIIDATAADASVINLSFGTATQPPPNLLQQAIQQAQAAGVVVVAAAGNEGSNQQEFPASWPRTLSVAALAPGDGSLAAFSDFGGWVQVGAPGEEVVGPMPGGGYAIWAGTSMATPFVSGQAALIRSLVPGIQPDHVFQAIEQTATHLLPNPIHSGAINVPSSLMFALSHP
jgi:hypothetical protein